MTDTQAEVGNNTQTFERLETECRSYCRDIPAVFSKAHGSVVTSEEGVEYLDFFSGAGALNYGHNDPKMTHAVIDYLTGGGVVHALDMYTTVKRELLETLDSVLFTPNGWDYKVQFTGPTGTDANEAALKLARLATGRQGIVAFRGSYHGMSIGALSVSGGRRLRAAGGPLLQDVTFVPYEDGLDGEFDSIDYLTRHFGDPSGGNDLPAAVIVEGIQIQAGVYTASSKWLRDLRQWTQERGVVLIFDEVQTGCGRTGPFFSFEPSGIQPDIVTCAKSIGGYGLPLALLLIKRELDVWQPGDHTGTFRGNQLAFITGAIALRYWQDPEFLQLLDANAAAFSAALNGFRAEPVVQDCRWTGLIGGIDFGQANAETAHRFQHAAVEAGIIVERCGRYSEVVKLMPPINTPTEQLTQGLEKLHTILKSF